MTPRLVNTGMMTKMNESTVAEDVLANLAQNALEQWELRIVTVKHHSQRENTIYKVEDDRGQVYALRIHRAGYHDLQALESEHMWTAALADAGLSVPQAVDTRDGKAYATVKLPGTDQFRHVGLVKWIDGITLAQYMEQASGSVETAAVYGELGQLIADFHLATAGWSAPGNFKRHAWDAQGLMGAQPFWGRFWEIDAGSDEQRAALLVIRNRLFEFLTSLATGDAYGMIHADLNADNVLRSGNTLSVIDFDDAGFGWHAFDLAVAIHDQLDEITGQAHYDQHYDALMEGYRRRRPDCAHIVENVPLFVAVRSLTLLRWMQDRPEAGYTEMIPYLLELALDQAKSV
jgi:Ser/Thr protein kinase RdoA (MazF antagonist)